MYAVTASGSLTTLHSFTGGADGGNPYAGLVQASNGFLYGATETGGTNGAGTVYAISTSGSLTTLDSFSGGNDGGNPYAGLVQETSGILYGTTTKGGVSGAGTVYAMTASGSLTTIYSFTGGADGGDPYAGLAIGATGSLYGTTVTGGTSSAGTVYQITTSGSLSTLYAFTGLTDGGNPYGGVITGTDGNLYGTTVTDGTNGGGTVYRLAPGGGLTTLKAFTTGSDGGNPYAGLTMGSGGNFYGTATADGAHGHGVVFEVSVGGAAPFSGTMTFALLRDMAPVTTGYIAGFAEAGYYDKTDFFRITDLSNTAEPTFIAQGGDPTETGTGTPGFAFDNEFNPALIFYGQGQLAMANAGDDESTFRGTNGAQFFITQNPIRSLDFGYTIFGQLLTGFDVMEKVMGVPLGADGSSPVNPVEMDSVTVTEDNTDAILLVSAAGAVPNGATIKVNATDPSGNQAVTPSITGTTTTGLSFAMATFDDNVNDPPYVEPDPPVTTALHQKVSLPMKTHDLEFDYLTTNATALSNPTGASLSVSGNVTTITPNPFSPLGGITAGFYTYQPFTSVLRSPEQDFTAVPVGLGTGKLTGLPALFISTPSVPVSSSTSRMIGGNTPSFGSFLSSDASSSPSDFVATIVWGDGSAPSTGTNTVQVMQSPSIPTGYYVNGPGHSYSKPGIYPLNVTVTNTNGGELVLNNAAVIGTGPIYPFGRTFGAPKGLANGLVATFVDYTAGTVPGSYGATINWGDGSVGQGVIRGSNGSFQVYGKHQYTAGTSYPVDVTVNLLTNTANSGYAWSLAKLSGVPAHQPPFAQSHIVGELGNPGFGSGFLDEEVTLFNSGNLPSGPVTLKFYLSPTSAVSPLSASAIPLQVGKNSSYTTVSIPAGQAISGSVSDLLIPSGAVTHGHFLIMQVITSDPIGSHMDYPRAFADPDPLIE